MKSIVDNGDGTFTIDGDVYIKAIHKSDNTIDEKEATFLELIKGLERKEDRQKYPNSVFWIKNGMVWFEHNETSNYFGCSANNVWSVFESKYSMEYKVIQGFLNGMVEKHFNCKGVTTSIISTIAKREVEKHFNCKGVTTPIGNIFLSL